MIPSTAPAQVLWRWTSCTPAPAARARTALGCALDLMGVRGEALSNAVLAASELVANASEHAVGPYELRLRRASSEIICEVLDHDPHIPQRPACPTTALFLPEPQHRGGELDALCDLLTERGRGLHIVHQLTDGAWGFRRIGTGTGGRSAKVAWMVIRP
ncbi:ATP-binding protein [Streptomyces sp. NPDC050315]|uniref:ATP-binding protein n=1 Tax=Streptomyces sp. NPDC050315 TaxID=3155039 RepID=UPI00341E65D5